MREQIDVNKLQAMDATLYRAAISVAVQETQLIWTRYTGFIVMNGFLVSSWFIGFIPWVISAVGVLLIEYKLIAAQLENVS